MRQRQAAAKILCKNRPYPASKKYICVKRRVYPHFIMVRRSKHTKKSDKGSSHDVGNSFSKGVS